MKLSQYGFIMRDPSFTETQSSQLNSPAFAMTVYAVGNMESACKAAQTLAAEGVQLIELCGAFKPDMVQQIIDAVDGKIPVGHMAYGDAEREKLMAFLNK